MKWSLTVTGDESDVKDLERIARMMRGAIDPGELESKYSPFQDFLAQKKREGVTRLELTIGEIQKIIKADLPPSARKHDSFWRDRKRNIGAHIVRSGWHIDTINRNETDNQIDKLELHICTKKHKEEGKSHPD